MDYTDNVFQTYGMQMHILTLCLFGFDNHWKFHKFDIFKLSASKLLNHFSSQIQKNNFH